MSGDLPCGKCKTTGKVANPQAAAGRLAEQEARVRFCSTRLAADKKGRNLPFLPCEKCAAPSLAAAARAEFEKGAAAADAWLAARLAVDANLEPREPFVHIETTHFRLTFGLPKVVLEDKRVLPAHDAAHLYADRLETFYAWCQNLLGCTDKEARVALHQVFLMNDVRTLSKAATDYGQIFSDHRAGRAVGDPSVLVTWRDKGAFPDDAALHRHVVHNVSHLLVGTFFQKIWLVERAGWLEEGLANHAEMELFGLSGNTCNTEQAEEDIPDSDWEPKVRQLLASGKAVPFAQLMSKRADQLSGDEHLVAWSVVDFLIARDPKKLRELVIGVKKDAPMRDLLRDHYGLNPVGLDPLWSAWVLETYRQKP